MISDFKFFFFFFFFSTYNWQYSSTAFQLDDFYLLFSLILSSLFLTGSAVITHDIGIG